MMNGIIKKEYVKNIIAGIVVITMAVADLMIALQIPAVEYEEHEIETYLADGNYNGTDSSFEITNGSDDTIDSLETITHFNILEIVRGEGLGTLGFFLDGYEPVLKDKPENTQEMRHAAMDAFANEITGTENGYDQLTQYFQAFIARDGIGGKRPFTITHGKYTGYYKYVGKGKGFYSVYNNSVDKASHKAQMISKFYNNGSGRDNDYIWVESNQTVDEILNSDYIDKEKDIVVTNHRKMKYVNNDSFLTTMYDTKSYDSENNSYSDSSVEDWKKTHKINLKTVVWSDIDDMKNDSENPIDLIQWADLIYISNGDGPYCGDAYAMYQAANPGTYTNRGSLPGLNLESFDQVIDIYERVAVREDVALVVDANQIRVDNSANGVNTNFKKLIAMLFLVKNINDENPIGGSGRLMFMDYMKRYTSEPGKYTDAKGRNIYELQQTDPRYIPPGLRGKSERYMHFYQYNPGHPLVRNIGDAITGGHYNSNGILEAEHESSKAIPRRIRRSSKDYYEAIRIWERRATNPRGYYIEEQPLNDTADSSLFKYSDPYAAAREHKYCIDAYESMSNTTDYMYIDDNGTLHRDPYYSSDNGYWYCIDEDDKGEGYNWHCYKRIYWDKQDWESWTWEMAGTDCLKYWWFDKDSTRNQSGNLHLRYDYHNYGGYRALTTPEDGTYNNQSFRSENKIFTGNYFKDALGGRKEKREYTDTNPDHVERVGTPKYFFLSVNIENGDGVNVTQKGNKVMYINDYEIDEGITNSLPINFVVRSSENISKIEILKKTGSVDPVALSPAISYSPLPAYDNDVTDITKPLKFGGTSNLVLNPLDSEIPAQDTEHHNLKIYKYGGSTGVDLKKDPYFKSGSNNRFVLRVWIQPIEGRPGKYVDDEICIVKRGFFDLN